MQLKKEGEKETGRLFVERVLGGGGKRNHHRKKILKKKKQGVKKLKLKLREKGTFPETME